MKKHTSKKTAKRIVRHARIRAKVFGTSSEPRLSVFKSNRFVSAQLIDDSTGQVLAAAHSKGIAGTTGLERARNTGMAIAETAKKLHIERAVFDRGGFQYTGVIKAVAEGAREGGLAC